MAANLSNEPTEFFFVNQDFNHHEELTIKVDQSYGDVLSCIYITIEFQDGTQPKHVFEEFFFKCDFMTIIGLNSLKEVELFFEIGGASVVFLENKIVYTLDTRLFLYRSTKYLPELFIKINKNYVNDINKLSISFGLLRSYNSSEYLKKQNALGVTRYSVVHSSYKKQNDVLKISIDPIRFMNLLNYLILHFENKDFFKSIEKIDIYIDNILHTSILGHIAQHIVPKHYKLKRCENSFYIPFEYSNDSMKVTALAVSNVNTIELIVHISDKSLIDLDENYEVFLMGHCTSFIVD